MSKVVKKTLIDKNIFLVWRYYDVILANKNHRKNAVKLIKIQFPQKYSKWTEIFTYLVKADKKRKNVPEKSL